MMNRALSIATLILAGLALTGCAAAEPQYALTQTFHDGQFGRARAGLEQRMTRDRSDRNYLLDGLRMGMLAFADGHVDAAEPIFEDIYGLLRTAGLNRDRTVASVMLHEGVRIWKGEPFEQALTLAYMSALYGMQGDWHNARAASGNSLFHLRDYGQDVDGTRLDHQDIAERAARRGEDYLDEGYRAVESDFALGYLLNGIANQQVGLTAEAGEQFTRALQLRPELGPLVEALARGDYNTVLLVDFGRGPRKVGTGPGGAIATFVPTRYGDRRSLHVRSGGHESRWPIVTDVNAMATDHMWTSLEDLRIAKSIIGQGLMIAGAVVASEGSRDNVLVGLGLILAGAATHATAHADTRHCELMPQRIYLAPLRVEPGQRVEVSIDGMPGSRLVLHDLEPPADGRPRLHYVRLLDRQQAPSWAVGTQRHYFAPEDVPAGEPCIPVVLGGRCLVDPDLAPARGALPAGLTSLDLVDLYRMEGIVHGPDARRSTGAHLLEGGRRLDLPRPGTLGYARLLFQTHAPYRPRNRQTVQEIDRITAATAAATPAP